MKGLIFNSFIEFAESQLGMEFVDEMLAAVPLASGGAYTNVGTYKSQELLDMIAYILERTDVDPVEMQREFGKFTFAVLANRYADLVSGFSDSFDCIYHVDQIIHRNVRKLYPDAELPDMRARLLDSGDTLTMEYRSSRPFMHVAHGLLLGCIQHFGETVDVKMKDRSGGDGTRAEFVLVRNAQVQ